MIRFEDFWPGISGQLNNMIFPGAWEISTALAPVALAIVLGVIFWPLWVAYVRSVFLYKQKNILLEIKLPKDTFKSPLAMEQFLSSLYQTAGEATWYDKFWLGKVRAWFSLEMVSLEGRVHFYIWLREGQRNFTESSLYAQFPGIEVHSADDYAKSVYFEPDVTSMFAVEMALTQPDPYPIKTYVDWGLDKDPKEEYKVDPIVPMIEFLGSVGAHQQVWIQIIIRAHKKEQKKEGTFFGKTDAWKDEAKKIINETLSRDPKTKVAGKTDTNPEGQRITVSPGEQDTVKALERSISKLPFDVGIRCMYIAEKDFFNGTYIGGLLGSFRPFSSEHLNGFKPNTKIFGLKFDYPWEDYKNYRLNKELKVALKMYKRRNYFYEPYLHKIGKPFVLNVEELATIFHFPGQVSQTPSLTRIPSKKSEAPANLPI